MARTSPVHHDKLLADRILAGDESAFQEMFDDVFPRLHRFAMLRLAGNHDDVCEVVQQTCCRALENMSQYRGEASLFGWMCQICRNAIADLARGRKHMASESPAPDHDVTLESLLEFLSAPPEDEPETQVMRMDLVRLIQSTLDCLPAHYGDVLEWKYVDGLPLLDIAQRLDLGPKAAESLLGRARAAFRDAMVLVAGSHQELPLLMGGRRG